MLAANNMRGMPSGGITQRPPMPMPMARGAGGGIVAFKEGTLVDANAEEEEVAAIADAVSKKREEDSGTLTAGSEGIVGALQNIVSTRQAQQEKARQKILDRVDADKGFTSDAFINRLLAFGGAENFGQGLIQSGRAGQQYQREQEARTQQELDRVSGQESNLDALLLQSLAQATSAGIQEDELELKGDELAFQKQFNDDKIALDYRKVALETYKTQGDLDLRARALTNEEAKTELQRGIAEVDKAYKEAQSALGLKNADIATQELAVRIAAHRNDFLRLSKEAMLDLGADASAEDVEAAINRLGNNFDVKVANDRREFAKKNTTTSNFPSPTAAQYTGLASIMPNPVITNTGAVKP